MVSHRADTADLLTRHFLFFVLYSEACRRASRCRWTRSARVGGWGGWCRQRRWLSCRCLVPLCPFATLLSLPPSLCFVLRFPMVRYPCTTTSTSVYIYICTCMAQALKKERDGRIAGVCRVPGLGCRSSASVVFVVRVPPVIPLSSSQLQHTLKTPQHHRRRAPNGERSRECVRAVGVCCLRIDSRSLIIYIYVLGSSGR